MTFDQFLFWGNVLFAILNTGVFIANRKWVNGSAAIATIFAAAVLWAKPFG